MMFYFLKACFGLSKNNPTPNDSNKTIKSQKKCTCKSTKPKQSEDTVFPPFFHDFI